MSADRMRADRWDICPKCQKELDLLNNESRAFKLSQTLRQNYELYFRDTILNIQYSCFCEACNFSFERNISIDILS